MSRNPVIEAIHEARFTLETCAPHEETEARAELARLVREALERTGTKVSPQELLDALFDDYREFRRLKKRQGWPRI